MNWELSKIWRSKLNGDKNLGVLLTVGENPQTTTKVIAGNNDVCKISVLRIVKTNKYDTYKIKIRTSETE